MTVSAKECADGWVDIVTDFPLGANHDPLVLVRVRPTGLLTWGELNSCFVPEWVPEMIEALKLAQETSDATRKRHRSTS